MDDNFAITLVKERDWHELVEALRRVPLMGDSSLLPYKRARFRSEVVEASAISPLSRYVLRDNLSLQERLQEKFLRKYKIDTLDLNGKRGGVYFKVSREKGLWLMSPPIVEVSPLDGGKLVLLDGEHRFMLAREMGQKVRVIVVEGVPKRYPMLAYPIRWDEVKICDKVPGYAGKRNYRFKSLKEFPDVSEFSQVEVTEESFRYFFYRDLSGVCSSGVRMVENG